MRVAIIGGGPAGAFCALCLLGGAKHQREPLEVVLFDRKLFCAHGPRGCNFCAGVISHSLVQNLQRLGLPIPRRVVQREIQGYHFETQAGGVRLRKEPGATVYTAFRSLGPPDADSDEERSFDHYLLNAAVHLGATYLRELVTDLIPPRGDAPWVLEYGLGRRMTADVVVGAFGVHTPLLHKLEQRGFGYRPPRTIHACQADLPLDEQAVSDCLEDEIKIFSLGLPGIKFAALIPKQRHVTVTLVGEHVQRAHLEEFLQLPNVRKFFPRGWHVPTIYCHCHPKIPVSAALCPIAERLVIIGDAHTSRYLKNGLNSAFYTALSAANTILHPDESGRLALRRHYLLPCRRRFLWDNAIGRALFHLHERTMRSEGLTRLLLRTVQAEGKIADSRARPATLALWNMFTGDLPYSEVLWQCLRPSFALHLMQGALAAPETGAPSGEGEAPAEPTSEVLSCPDESPEGTAGNHAFWQNGCKNSYL